MKKTFFLFLIMGFSLDIFSKVQIKKDTLSQKKFQELVDSFYENKHNTSKAAIYAKAIYNKAIIENDTMNMLHGKFFLADILNDKNIYIRFCDSLINITKKHPSKNFPSAIYYHKSVFYFNEGINSKALEELTLSKQTLRKNDSLKHLLFIQLAMIKSSVGEVENAIDLYKKAYLFAKQKKYLSHQDFSTLSLNIASAYKKLNKIDSAFFYNNEAVSLYEKINDSLSLGYSFYVLGSIENRRKNYNESIISYKKSIPYIISDENYRILIRAYVKIGVQYNYLKNKKNALKYHLKADSLFNVREIPSKYLEDTYKYLINHSKNNKNLRKQLLYINKLLKIKDFKLNEENKIKETLTEEYDIPNLLSEKKQVIKELEKEINESKRNKVVYISLLTLSFVLVGYQVRRKKTLKKRFIALANQNKTVDKKESETIPQQTINKHELSNETIDLIINGLEAFEKNADFLNSKINLQLLADRLDTNTSYLSKVINQHKKNSFSSYINQLRIEYAIEKLKSDTLWRKYTIKAIAKEVGFKNAESFSRVFYKFTGIKPSYFIKELEKSEKN
ncbi:AraC family transcriptional regulator [Tenacibaculum larymnensis]|uniref:AraC family transcriptional regulator n=1 Tax=Tenacibaculum larymnensis TaxID=2878201 RepID=A0A9X4IQ66_9FLAO|nr:AraC family transcriptional regulator [Tenacibaculum larymnensis]MDE1206637.1 AraC family transcriptional regulator [Tenacibaculum larymnensis]